MRDRPELEGWAIDPNEFPGKFCLPNERVINSVSLSSEIGVKCTNDYPRVLRPFVVQPNEVPSIERQHRASVFGCKVKHLVVGKPLIGVSCLLNGDHVSA